MHSEKICCYTGLNQTSLSHLTTKTRQKKLRSLPFQHLSFKIHCTKLPTLEDQDFHYYQAMPTAAALLSAPQVTHTKDLVPASQLFTSHPAESFLQLYSHGLQTARGFSTLAASGQ